MRKKLSNMSGERRRFCGWFVRYGTKPAYRGPDLRTVLLADVTDVVSGEVVTDHLWFNLTKGFAALGELGEGDIVSFDARVTGYQKGYRGRRDDVYKPVERDYRLERPTKIRLEMSEQERQEEAAEQVELIERFEALMAKYQLEESWGINGMMVDGYSGLIAEVYVILETRGTADITLNEEQVRELHDYLGRWLAARQDPEVLAFEKGRRTK